MKPSMRLKSVRLHCKMSRSPGSMCDQSVQPRMVVVCETSYRARLRRMKRPLVFPERVMVVAWAFHSAANVARRSREASCDKSQD